MLGAPLILWYAWAFSADFVFGRFLPTSQERARKVNFNYLDFLGGVFNDNTWDDIAFSIFKMLTCWLVPNWTYDPVQCLFLKWGVHIDLFFCYKAHDHVHCNQPLLSKLIILGAVLSAINLIPIFLLMDEVCKSHSNLLMGLFIFFLLCSSCLCLLAPCLSICLFCSSAPPPACSFFPPLWGQWNPVEAKK